MKVSDLQDLLTHVGHLLESAGGRGAAELAEFRESLQPFRDFTAKEFSKQLVKLANPDQPKPKAGGRKGKAGAVDLDALQRQVQHLYASAPDQSTTIEQIDEAMQRLEPLTKDALVMVAESIGLVGMKNLKKKADIVSAIRQRIVARKGTAQRANLLDRVPAS